MRHYFPALHLQRQLRSVQTKLAKFFLPFDVHDPAFKHSFHWACLRVPFDALKPLRGSGWAPLARDI